MICMLNLIHTVITIIVWGKCFLMFAFHRAVFLNCWAAARYQALASIIPGCERFSWNLSF